MPESQAGGFEYRGRVHRFDVARCAWSVGSLDVEASGGRGSIHLVSVPFPGAASYADLPGRVWEPDADAMAVHADAFVEGVVVRGRDLTILGARVACRKFDAGQGVLAVDFRLVVEDPDRGGEEEIEGVAYCRARGLRTTSL